MGPESSQLHYLRETPFYFAVEGSRLFAILHMPQSKEVRRAVLICHALAEEKLWSHRVLVSAARAMASAGYAVLRFDYRGEGDSDLEFEETRLTTRIEDTVRAARVLLDKVATVDAVTLLGHRIGAWVAASAATSLGKLTESLILWDPIVDGRSYVLQLLRSNLAAQMAARGKVAHTRDQLIRSLLAGHAVPIDGYLLSRNLYEDLVDIDWQPVLAGLAVRSLLLEVATGRQSQPSDQARQLARAAQAMDLRLVNEAAFWRESKIFHGRSRELAVSTINWLGAW